MYIKFLTDGDYQFIYRRVYKNPLLKMFKSVESFSAGKIEFTAGHFPRPMANIYMYTGLSLGF